MSATQQSRCSGRNPDRPVVDALADGYAKWYLSFQETGDTTRSALASIFAERTRAKAKMYVELWEVSRPTGWNDVMRDPGLRRRMEEYYDERQAWACALDRLCRFSDGEAVDADALREALVRESFRRDNQNRRGRTEARVLSKAARIVRGEADLDAMTDERYDQIDRDYQYHL